MLRRFVRRVSAAMDRGESQRPMVVLRAGDTIISVPHQAVLKPMCLEEGDSVSRLIPDNQRLFKVRLADTEGHRRSASFLVERRFAWRGYEMGAASGAHPDLVTFSAYDQDEVVATISIGLDGPAGLFVDHLYRSEVDRVRAQGRKVCEFTKLAIDGGIKSKPVLATLFHIAFIYARQINSCSDLFVEVNPRHELFYRRMLGFSSWGPERHDPRVNAVAVLLRLELAHAAQQIAEMGGHMELAAKKRSLYPYFLSPREEAGISVRLQGLA